MQNLVETESRRISARIARHVPAIADARARGVGWAQIAAVVGPEVGIDVSDLAAAAKRMQQAFTRAVRQIEKGKLRSGPLPVVQQMPEPATPPVPGTAASTQRRQSTKDFLASLEQIGGNKK